MYDIEELESLWLKYKIKQYLKRGGIVLVIFLAIGIPIAYFNGSFNSQKEEIAKDKVVKRDKDIVIVDNNKESINKKSIPSARLKESIDRANPTSEAIDSNSYTAQSSNKTPIVKSNESAQEGVKKEVVSNNPHFKIEMIDGENEKVIKELEKRFWINRSYDDAMYLANYYYKHKNYKKAQEWAMQANTIDSAKSDSWIVFSKAKAKEGHRKEALWVLQKYYDTTGDMEVGLLIDKIRKGENY